MYRISAPAPVGPASGPLLEVRPRSGSGQNYGRIWASRFGAYFALCWVFKHV